LLKAIFRFVGINQQGSDPGSTLKWSNGDSAVYPLNPNSFNPVTTIQYGLPVDAAVNIIVYDLQGRIAAELANEFKSAGYHTLHWDASNHASGIYFVKMMTEEFTKTQKLMLVK